MSGILAGKKALIVGVATERSIAWGIAQAMKAQGAELALSYANDKFRERVLPLGESIGVKLTLPLDVGSDEQLDAAFETDSFLDASGDMGDAVSLPHA